MQRTEADVVKKTLAILEEYERNPEALKSLDIAERVASREIFRQLRGLLAPLVASEATATQKGLKKCELLLRKWNCLIGTPFLACYQPNALANRALIALAEDLATIFPFSALELLFPKVIIPEGFQTKHYNNFVVTEDGYLIGIIEGLDAVRNRVDHRFLHPTGKDLDPDLLMEHSMPAWNYAVKVRNLFRPKAPDLAESDKLRAELAELMEEKKDYKRMLPAHSAKEAGKKRLMLAFTKKIHTPQQLAELMDANVSKEEWIEFLRTMERDELCRIMIPKRAQTAQKKDQTDQAYKIEQSKAALPAVLELAGSVIEWPSSDNAKRVLVYALVFLYHDLRNDQGEYLDSAGGWLGGNSKTQALKQTQGMQDFLLSNEAMQDLEKYLKEKGIPPVYSPTCLALKNKIIDAGRHCEQKQEDTPANVSLGLSQ